MSEKEGNKLKLFIKGPSLGYIDNFSTRKMWEEIAEELGGEFKISHDSGHVLEIHNIRIPHRKWQINISVSDSRPLKFMMHFDVSQDFDMTLSKEDFIERLIKKFSKKEIELGWKEFDKQYLIMSKRSDLVKKIITKDIQKLLLKHNIYSISYHTKKDHKTSEFISVIQRKAGSKEMMMELIEMYKLLIDQLEKSRTIK